MYKVHGTPFTRTFRVLWALEEMELPYELNPATPHSEDVRRLNASGKIPVLEVDGAVLTDSTAILTYLADKHGKFTHPAGTLERAAQDGLTQLILDEFDSVLWTASRHSFVLPEDQRCPEIKDSLKWEFARSLDRLEPRIEGPFLMGETMTIADIILSHCLNWAFSAKFPIQNEAALAYSKSMRARPAFQRVAALGKS
jgi:glutathione S-transferase